MTTPRDPTADALRAALDREAPGPDEDALLARALDRAMARLDAEPRSAAEPPRVVALPSRRPGRVLKIAIPLAAAFVTSLAMGAAYMVYRTPAPNPPEVHHPVPEAPLPPRPTSNHAPVGIPNGKAAPSISVDDLPNATPKATAGTPSVARAAEPVASAADLFRDANAARRAGDVSGAIDLYRKLVDHHRGSPEAHAARVSLGRLLLDRRNDPAGALVELDAYLASPAADRSLAEEARLGRALVFQRQGRSEEERRAWKDLLDRHPDSLHAARARERLSALDSRDP